LVLAQHLLILPDVATGSGAAWLVHNGLQLNPWCWDWIELLLKWVDHAVLSILADSLIWSALLAGTILVQHLVWWANAGLAAASSGGSALDDSLVELAVLACSIFKNFLSDVAVVWATLGSVTLSSGECWAVEALAVGGELLSVVTLVWNASLSVL